MNRDYFNVMMESIREKDLNVSYNEVFYESEMADQIFEELYKLSYKDIQVKIGSKWYSPFRKVCAFSDDGLSYKFSGTSIKGDEWTPLILRMKEDVETKVGFQFNYVLVTLYENGHSKISAHMDNEQDLDPDSPIAALSFGAKRNLIFHRNGFQSVTLPVTHGSLYVMNPPTNKMWKHSIPAEPGVLEPRISLTFRKIKIHPENPAKKSKLQLMDDDLPTNDWMDQCLQKDNSVFDIMTPKYFHLSDDVTCAVKEFNGSLRVDIRRNKLLNKRRIPTKDGIVINPMTWYYLCAKLYEFNFVYKDASLIVNNCLLCLNLGECLHLQHVECEPKKSVRVKETFITLNHFEVATLLEMEETISKCLIEELWTTMLPRKISSVCQSFSSPLCDKEEILDLFTKCIERNMESEIKNVYHCQGCIVDSFSQINHDCMYQTAKNKFESLGPRAWLLLNIDEVVKDLSVIPSFNINIVKSLTIEDYKKLLFAHDTPHM